MADTRVAISPLLRRSGVISAAASRNVRRVEVGEILIGVIRILDELLDHRRDATGRI
jgi:hypothetical protein